MLELSRHGFAEALVVAFLHDREVTASSCPMRSASNDQFHVADTCKCPSQEEYKELKKKFNLNHIEILHAFLNMRKAEANRNEMTRVWQGNLFIQVLIIHPQEQTFSQKELGYLELWAKANANASQKTYHVSP